MEPLKLTFARATTNDAPLLIELEQKLVGEEGAALSLDEARDEIIQNTLHFIRIQNELVGTIAHNMRHDNTISIVGVVVVPEYQKQDVARLAVLHLLEQFKDSKRIDMVVHPENIRARKLFESLGFRVEEEIDDYRGEGEPRIVLVKEYFAI